MRLIRTSALAAIASLTAMACEQAAPTALAPVDLAFSDVESLSAALGEGALVSHDCVGVPGDVLQVVTPVNQTDFWVTDVEIITANCRELPDGQQQLNVKARILSDIPLPGRAVFVDLADENGVPKVFNVYWDGVLVLVSAFPCGSPQDPFPITFDCRISSMPAGIHTVDARFDP